MKNHFQQNITQKLVQHAVSFSKENLTTEDNLYVKNSLIDALAAIIGGSFSEGLNQAYHWAEKTYQSGKAKIIFRNTSLIAIATAQLHATAGHALDYDDTLDAGGGMHAGALVHSVALAVISEVDRVVTWQEYATAIAVGLDIAVRLALATTEDFGWHRTSAFGIFAATIVASRLYQLNEQQTTHALGLAYSQASGNRQCIDDGGLSKRFQAGFAARDAITATQLAKQGITSATQVFEGADGFFKLYQRNKININEIFTDFTVDLWHKKISFKPYPCGRNLHGILDSVAKSKFFGQSEQIKSITVYLKPDNYQRLSFAYPQQVVQAQFSVPFVIALYLSTQKTPLKDFAAPESVKAQIKPLFDRIVVIADEEKHHQIQFEYTDGDSEQFQVQEFASGHPNNPLTKDRLKLKLFDCYKFAQYQNHQQQQISNLHLDDLWKEISALTLADDVRNIITFLIR